VVTWHNAILGRGRSAAAGRLLQRGVARAADLTLGASSDLVAVATALGARRARLGPVAAPVLPAATTERAELRASLGLGPDDVAVLTVSRLAPQKNLSMVLDVAAAVRDRPQLQFLVVGAGPERGGLQQRIDVEKLPVSMLGRREDIADLLAAADLALLVSTWEARALVAQEALLAGLPLVSTRVGGIEELVGGAAVLVELDDVAAAAAAVTRLADDPGERRRLSAAGRARAAGWPDEDQVALDVLAAYAEVR
jgi:glycosyltransferase involved in cell wall biosynthesis